MFDLATILAAAIPAGFANIAYGLTTLGLGMIFHLGFFLAFMFGYGSGTVIGRWWE